MTQDEIIDMAIQAGASPDENKIWLMYAEEIETFAKLIATNEREACKTLAKEYAAEYKEGGRLYPMLNGSITKTAASACDHIVYIIGERGRT